MNSWLTINPKLQTGVTLINSLNTKDFVSLLQFIKQPKHEPNELAEFEASLKLDRNNFELVLKSIAHLFKKSSKIIIKPTILQKQLVEDLKLDPDKSEEFVKAWTNTTREHFENLENLPKLEKISWELNLQTSTSSQYKQTEPVVRFKLGLCNLAELKQENVIFELQDADLLHMYNTLENIQNVDKMISLLNL